MRQEVHSVKKHVKNISQEFQAFKSEGKSGNDEDGTVIGPKVPADTSAGIPEGDNDDSVEKPRVKGEDRQSSTDVSIPKGEQAEEIETMEQTEESETEDE